MKVVITGGTGDIGRYLIDELKQHGHQLIILSRNPDKYRGSFDQAVELVQWDAKTAAGWVNYLDEADAIINLAGENLAGESFLPGRWTEQKKLKIVQSRQQAGEAVVEAVVAATKKPKVVIQSSAVGYYGPRNDDTKLDESASPGSDFLGTTCAAWERTTSAVQKMGVRQVVIRTGLVLMHEGGPLPRLLFQFKVFGGGPFGGGQQWWSWLHIRDEVRAIRFLLESETANGPYNLTAPNAVTNKQFSKILGRVLNRPSFMPIPGFAMKLLLGEVATTVLDGQRVIPKRLLEAGFEFEYNDLGSALENLTQ
ncbi:MAG: TIGR01777 family oxidoreductase [Candidatus Promineifilaceae bacterium]